MCQVTVPVSIGALLAVFAEPSLNPEWNERLAMQELVRGAGGRIVAHQVYPMPWPLVDRDFVLACEEVIDEASLSFSSSCGSVSHPAFPEDPTVVRGELVRSSWRFVAVPEGTFIHFESVVDPKGSIPRPIVVAAQRLGAHNPRNRLYIERFVHLSNVLSRLRPGKDKLISALVARQRTLGRPPHPRFERWAARAIDANRTGAPPAARRPLRSRAWATAVGATAAVRSGGAFTLGARQPRLF